MIVYSWLKRDFRNIHKKYTVGGGNYSAKTDTLTEAKKAGVVIAKKEVWRGKWNIMYITISIGVDSGDGFHYKNTGWKMHVPVRGTGATADRIVSEIKRRHGVKPMVWTRR